MIQRRQGLPVHPLLIAATIAAVVLVVLPIWGMGLSYVQPTGLFALPPMVFSDLLPLIWRSLALAIGVSALSLCMGTWLAWIENRTDFRGRHLLSLLAVLPLATPSYLIASMVRHEMAPEGSVGKILGRTEAFTGFWPALLVLTVACTPYVHILVSAALQRCPAEEEEAARSLGAGPFRILRTVLFPRLRPSLSFAMVLVSLYVVSDFGAVAILDCEVLTWELYQHRGSRDAVLLGFGLIAVVIPLLAIVRILHGQAEVERRVTQRAHHRRPLRGAAWTVSFALLVLVIGLGVFLPVLTLGNWVWMGFSNPNIHFAPILNAAGGTLLYSTLGAILVLCMAFAPAWLTARRGGTTGTVVENAVYLTSSVPGILIAVGLLQLMLGLKRMFPEANAIWGTLEAGGIFLLIGYGMRFLAQAYAALKPAMLQVNLSAEESARLLGASPWRRFRTLNLPALQPGLWAAYMLVFLGIAKELPITLTLLPLDHTTLSYRIYSGQEEAVLQNVGLSGIILLVFAIGLQLAIIQWRAHVERAHHHA